MNKYLAGALAVGGMMATALPCYATINAMPSREVIPVVPNAAAAETADASDPNIQPVYWHHHYWHHWHHWHHHHSGLRIIIR